MAFFTPTYIGQSVELSSANACYLGCHFLSVCKGAVAAGGDDVALFCAGR